MKCNNCNSSNIVRVNRRFDFAGNCYKTETIEYICLDCGKIMTFSPNLVNIIKSRMEEYNTEISKLKNEIATLEKQIGILENDDEFINICNRKEQLESLVNSIDITIREKREYEAELASLREPYNKGWYRCVKPVEKYKKDISKMEEEINWMQKEMEKGNWEY